MKKRTSIIGTLLLSMFVIFSFFIAIVLLLWFNQYFATEGTTTAPSSFIEFFLNISLLELFAIFFAGIIMTSLIVRFIASNITANFQKFNQFFYDAMSKGEMIDEDNLNFKEFTILAHSVNSMIQKANQDKKRLEFNKNYLQMVLDAQKNMVIVRSQAKMEMANQAFYNFMKVQDIDEFRVKHNCISEFFIDGEENEYLTRTIDGLSWVNYILMNPLKTHKVKLAQDGKNIIFEVNASVKEVEEYNKVVLTFNNINELEEQKRAFEKASTIDALTRVSNRLKFDTILEQQIEMKRYNHSFSLILFDIDDFKKINDNYGHKVGDNILVELAMIVKNAMRKSDAFARWGGEEFAIILPQSRIKTAVKIAEKLRAKIDNHTFEEDMKVTCSFGVCEYKKAYDFDTLIERTDEKLYLAKHKGKNQVQF